MFILENGEIQSHMDMARYSTLIKITIFKGIFRTDCLHIMVFFWPKTSSTKVNSSMEWLRVRVNMLRGQKQSRANLKKIIPLEIAYKKPKTIFLSETMKMVHGAKENSPGTIRNLNIMGISGKASWMVKGC